jgi:hypothetical protein
MPFTGRLGTPNSRFADIVFGAVDGFGPDSPDFRAHQLTSAAFRILFNGQVTDSALDPSVYSLASLASPGTAHVPAILSVEFYDELDDSVVLVLDAPLTTTTQYAVSVSSVEMVSSDYLLNTARSFTANVVDPPRALGAFLSKRGEVDVLFDKPVGPFSGSATFTIADAAGGPAFAMTQATWASESIPETTLRLHLPAGTPTALSFVIATSGITDVSLNHSSETVPLTLALRSPLPFSLADLTQLQLTDAFVTDVSSDFFRTANVRVFFSCPVSGAASTGAWSVSASTAHLHLDAQDGVAAPPATDLPSLITLLNQLRAGYAGHVTALEQIHVSPLSVTSKDAISAPAATDQLSSVRLLNQLLVAIPDHYLRPRVHLYPDTINLFSIPQVDPSDLAGAIAASNLVAASYKTHLLLEYPLQFSTAYHSPVGSITAYCRESAPNLAFDVSGPYTYFADLRVVLDTEVPSLHVRATLTSEDGGSSCTPSDYTGSIVARPGAAPAVITSSLVSVDRWVDLRTDRNVSLVAGAPMVIVGADGLEVPTDPTVLGSLPVLIWAYNQALEAYQQHIVPGAAGHQVTDVINLVSPTDYASLPLASSMSAANGVRQKVMAHMASATIHYHADPSAITAPEATDLDSYMALVADLTQVLASHLVRVGPHLYAGYRMVSAPVFDTVRLSSPSMKDGSASRAVGLLQDSYVYNGPPVVPAPSVPAYRSHVESVDLPFTALAVRPSLASVLPQSGLSFDPVRGPVLGADQVLAFFSKPMREVPVTPAALPITGGPIQPLGSGWVSPVLASVAVTKMEPIPYSVTAVGLTDHAGNLVY